VKSIGERKGKMTRDRVFVPPGALQRSSRAGLPCHAGRNEKHGW